MSAMQTNAKIQERLIFDGNEFAKTLFQEIQEAKKEILVASYIVEDDELGKRVLEALLKKAQEGVHVRMIVDGYGSWDWINDEMPKMNHSDFVIHIYHPLPWKVVNLGLGKFFHFLLRIHRRNHQKIFIFDRQTAIIGSRNIHDEAIQWRETSLWVQGESVAEILEIFENMWVRSRRRLMHRWEYKNFKSKMSDRVLSNHFFLWRRKNRRRMLDRILGARSHIEITTPYFYPTRKLFRVLRSKAKQGVKVLVLVPKFADVQVSTWITQMHYQNLLDSGVQIYEYVPTILHAKSTVVDEWHMVGSSNFNRRSILLDVELDYVLSQDHACRELREKFNQDINQSERIRKVESSSFFKNILAKIATTIIPSWF